MQTSSKSPEPFFYRVALLCIVCFAVWIRHHFLFIERLWPDEALYAWAAKRIFEHPELLFSQEISGFHPPLFSVFLSLWHFFFPPLQACHLMVFVTNILGIIAVYVLGRKIHSPFVGLFAAMAMAFNPPYIMMSSLILIDGVLTVAMVFLLYVLSEVKTKISRPDFYLGFMVMVMMLLKWSGGLVLPFIFLFYMLAFKELPLLKRVAKAAVPLTFGAVLLVFLIWMNYVIFGEWIPKVFTASSEGYKAPFLFYFGEFPDILHFTLVPFLLIGLWTSLTSRDRNQWVHTLWVIFAWLIISAMTSKDSRFIMFTLPSIFLLTGMGMEAALQKIKTISDSPRTRPICLAAVLLVFMTYNLNVLQTNKLLPLFSYVGLMEAGEYLKHQDIPPDTTVIASSPRSIRYFSDINFKEYGGNLSGFPKNEADFLNLIKNTTSEIIVLVDPWEWTQPKWVYPSLTMSNNTLIKDFGFKFDIIFSKKVLLRKAKDFEEHDVIWILRRPALGKGGADEK